MKFGKKLSVSDFKAMFGTSELLIIKSPKSGKLFVTANGACVAAVSKNYDKSKSAEFVELIIDGEPTSTIWCLNNPSESNVVGKL
jgi:hypothetical protein